MNRKQKKTMLLTLGLVVVLVALLLGVRACSAHQEEQEAQEAEQQRLESQVPTASDTFESITYDNGDVTLDLGDGPVTFAKKDVAQVRLHVGF